MIKNLAMYRKITFFELDHNYRSFQEGQFEIGCSFCYRPSSWAGPIRIRLQTVLGHSPRTIIRFVDKHRENICTVGLTFVLVTVITLQQTLSQHGKQMVVRNPVGNSFLSLGPGTVSIGESREKKRREKKRKEEKEKEKEKEKKRKERENKRKERERRREEKCGRERERETETERKGEREREERKREKEKERKRERERKKKERKRKEREKRKSEREREREREREGRREKRLD